MSINKVLNRPIFRNAALKKGHLKTINANTGVMVGSPYGGAPVPAIRKPPTFMERMKVSSPVRMGKNLVKGIANIPFAGGYYGGEKVAEGLGIKDPLMQMPFGMAGGYYASRALPALAGLPALTSAAIAAGPLYLGIAGKKEYDRIQKMSPKEREAHNLKSQQFGMSYLSDEDFNTQFGKVRPKTIEEKVVKSKEIIEGRPGSGRVSLPGKSNSKTLKADGDPLLQDNVANSDDIANLDAVQENSIMGSSIPPGEEGGPGFVKQSDVTTATTKDDKDLSKDEKKNIENQNTAQGNNEIALGGPSDDVDFNKTIALAKKYQEEVFKNEGSQAGLVFLANLASGLLTGTTKRAGIAGAMEVFGQAIGPAVNNYATIKLKEGELRANNREASLNAAVDHMKFLNDAAIAKIEASVVERPDVDPGVVQFRGADGKLRNYRGYIGSDGTSYLPGGLGSDGREQLIPISQSGAIKDSEGNVLGSFENFQKQEKINNRLFEISDILGNRYNALSVARDVLKTLNQMDASGEKVKAGAALAVDQFTRRLSGVAKELVGLNVLDNDISQMTLGALEDKMNKLQEDEFAAIDRSDLSDEAKKEAKEKISKDTLLEKARKKLKGRGILSGLTREEQEKLAVQEVTLTYALANTFKDQDRLTQRDVNAAKEIVNIFSLGRSSADVRASITAIANQLESDIRRQEELFRDAGGLESRITNLRGLAEFETFDKGTVESQLSKDLSLEEIENIIEGIN